MQVDDIIQEVAKRHHLILSQADPIFITVTLNELVLAHYVEKMQVFLDEAQDKIATLSAEQITAAKILAEKLVNQTSIYMTDNVKKSLLDISDTMQQDFALALSELKKEQAQTQQLQKKAHYSVLMAMSCLTLLVGIGIGAIFF